MDRYKRKVRRFVLVPSDGGKFEVSVGEKLIWSKLETGTYPEPAAMMEIIDAMLPARKA
jgi:selT/selW/selH-like putative selenoprotein